jgi:tetratricopeptide (TPR) repeat protein
MKHCELFSLMFLATSLQAAGLELELPRAEWLLQPVSPPLLQREGTALVTEQQSVQELVAFIGREEYEQGLASIRSAYPNVLEQLEAGDPDKQLPQRVVAGGFMPNALRSQLSSTLFYLIGHCYMALEQYLPAETAFKTALIPLPDYIRVHESLGLLYLQTGRFPEARVNLSRAAALGLNTSNLFGALGYLNQQSHNYWGAVSGYQQAMMLDPDNYQWQQGLLFALSQTRQYDSALTLVEQLLQQNPDDPALWLYRSQLSLQAGEREAALTSLETAIRLGDTAVANLQIAATLHMESGSSARAVELLKTGVGKGMDYGFVDQALGWLAHNGQWSYLEELLEEVKATANELSDTDRSKLLTREAGISRHDDEDAAANTALQQALELDPGNGEALMALADLQRENRNYNQAELFYQRASAYELYRENATISMAQLAIDQDNLERALQLLRDVVNRNPARSDLDRNINSLENLVLLRE